MENQTAVTFIMSSYAATERFKHGLFSAFLLLYVTIISLNLLLVAVICRHKALHRPMNVFLCVLSVNEMYGSTALLPSVMKLLLSDAREVTVSWCLAQVFFLHTYAAAEFCILALMGYDRYVAICYPLHYHAIVSRSRVGRLAALACLYPCVVFLCYYALTLRLSFCGRAVPKLYCVNMEVVKNSCSDASYISTVGLVLIFLLVVPQVAMILFSYAKICKVCSKLPRESQAIALKTCIPHLLSLMNYTVGSLFEILQSRFDMSHLAVQAQIFLSLYFIIIPPATNPVLYGLGTHLIRVHIVKIFIRYKVLPVQLAKAATAAPLV